VHEYSAKKTPRNSVVLGVLASTSIPIYFTPVKDPETGHLMVDGAVHNSLPLAFLSDEEAASSISIRFSNTRIENDKIDGFVQFLGQIFRCVTSNRTFEKHKGRVIDIPCGEYPMWNFEATEEERETLIKIGYESTKKFLEADEAVCVKRRNSL
jgi:predicted acylesterase/phospholipase RssA